MRMKQHLVLLSVRLAVHIKMTETLLTVQDYQQILKNRFNKLGIKYVSSEIKPISEIAQGFLGEHYKLEIKYEMENKLNIEYFFIKTKPTKNKVQVEAADDTGVYKKEGFLYDYLFKEFEKYGFDTSFAAKCYHCIQNQTLVLENLTTKGFVLPERRKLYDLESMKCLLKSVALFHAAGIAIEQRKSEELQKHFKLNEEHSQYFEEIFFVMYTNPKGYANSWWKSSFKTIDNLIDLLPENDAFKKEFKYFLHNAEIGKIFIEDTKFIKTLGHGDTWSNNMMFKYKNNVPIQCSLFDYQVLRYFYPSYDVLLSIYFNTNAEFRKNYYQDLIDYYYQSLSQILQSYQCDINIIMPLEQFVRSLDYVRADVLAQTTCVKMIIYIPPDTLSQAEDNNDTAEKKYEKYDDMTFNAFKNSEDYKIVMSESLYEFYDALKNKI